MYNKICVVAKDRGQYMHYTKGSELFVDFDRYEKIMGLDEFIVMYVGEWDERRDLKQIEDVIDSRRGVIKIYR